MVRIASIIVATLLVCYLAFVSYFFSENRQHVLCQGLDVVVVDSLDKHFVTKSDLVASLKKADLNPIDEPMELINTEQIEQLLLQNEMIAHVEAYKTPSGRIKLEVEQKIPILRVIAGREDCYIDNQGTKMPISYRYAVNVPVASGVIERQMAENELYHFALFLRKHDFWNDQIEQIYVYPDGEVELVPRVGSHRIVLGTFDDYEEKLANLKLFYDQAIPKVGWEKYSKISLKYKNQIVCTKR